MQDTSALKVWFSATLGGSSSELCWNFMLQMAPAGERNPVFHFLLLVQHDFLQIRVKQTGDICFLCGAVCNFSPFMGKRSQAQNS